LKKGGVKVRKVRIKKPKEGREKRFRAFKKRFYEK